MYLLLPLPWPSLSHALLLFWKQSIIKSSSVSSKLGQALHLTLPRPLKLDLLRGLCCLGRLLWGPELVSREISWDEPAVGRTRVNRTPGMGSRITLVPLSGVDLLFFCLNSSVCKISGLGR